MIQALSPSIPSRGPASPRTMVFSDVDDSLVTTNKDGLAHSREVMQQHASEAVIGFCTGRGLTMLQRMPESLWDFPMAFIATNNGQNLYVNTAGKPAAEFIRSLRPEDEDPTWAARVKEAAGGWDMSRISVIMRDLCQERGFQPGSPIPGAWDCFKNYVETVATAQGPVHIRYSLPPDQWAFHGYCMDGALSPEVTAHIQQFADETTARARAEGSRCRDLAYFPQNRWDIHCFLPPDIGKKALLEHLLGRYPSVRNVITLGDGVNDDMLAVPTFGNVDNYPILAGTSHPERQHIRENPRYLPCPPGDASSALQQDFERTASPA